MEAALERSGWLCVVSSYIDAESVSITIGMPIPIFNKKSLSGCS